jgi:hypothetical protein
MEPICSSEASVVFQRTTWRYFLEDNTLQINKTLTIQNHEFLANNVGCVDQTTNSLLFWHSENGWIQNVEKARAPGKTRLDHDKWKINKCNAQYCTVRQKKWIHILITHPIWEGRPAVKVHLLETPDHSTGCKERLRSYRKFMKTFTSDNLLKDLTNSVKHNSAVESNSRSVSRSKTAL